MTEPPIEQNTNEINQFIQQRYGENPRDRLDYINHLSINPDEDFDPDEISWITNRIAITNLVGAFKAAEEGYYIINTAGEIDSPRQVKKVVDPRVGPKKLREVLDSIADEIERVLTTTNNKIVVHCYMGMERSVLSVVWYLTRYKGKSIDEAYFEVGSIRPIAIDHSSWVTD